MDNKKLYIGGAIALAVIAIGYYYHKSKKSKDLIISTDNKTSGNDNIEITNKIIQILEKLSKNGEAIGEKPLTAIESKKATDKINGLKKTLPSVISELSDREKSIIQDGISIGNVTLDKIIEKSKKSKLQPMEIFAYLGEASNTLSKKYSEKEVNDLSNKFKKAIG